MPRQSIVVDETLAACTQATRPADHLVFSISRRQYTQLMAAIEEAVNMHTALCVVTPSTRLGQLTRVLGSFAQTRITNQRTFHNELISTITPLLRDDDDGYRKLCVINAAGIITTIRHTDESLSITRRHGGKIRAVIQFIVSAAAVAEEPLDQELFSSGELDDEFVALVDVDALFAGVIMTRDKEGRTLHFRNRAGVTSTLHY